MQGLTPRQRQVFDAIAQYRAERGYPPSIRELRRMLGVSSLRGVTIHLDALERKGWIERESTSRSIRMLAPEPAGEGSRSIPVLRTMDAGAPLLGDENVQGHIQLPRDMVGPADELFALKVRGNSMAGDDILDGDVVIVERQFTGEDGQIVAVLIGDEPTVRRLDMRSAPPRLLQSDPSSRHAEIDLCDARVLGKVVGLIRFRDSSRCPGSPGSPDPECRTSRRPDSAA